MSEAFRIDMSGMRGFPRPDGRVGIRNSIVVAYLVECAHHVARRIADPFVEQGVQLIGFPGCYPSEYAGNILADICTHPNVGAVVLVSLGCEEFRRSALKRAIEESGRPVEMLVIQQCGGTAPTIARGRSWIEGELKKLAAAPTVPIALADLVIATKCGGSDGLSGVTINPAVGHAFDLLVDAGATVMFEETCELVGCDPFLAARAATPELAEALVGAVQKAERYYADLGHGSFGGGNIKHGLSTLEEKSLGAYAKSGHSTIAGLIKPGDRPTEGGLYLLDVIPDGEVRFGFPNINDNAEIAELIACGSHVILFSTGRGSVVGSALAPVIKVCANPSTWRRMSDDMDIDAGRILEGRGTVDEVGREIYELLKNVAAGAPTKSEELGHQEFILTYKSFAPLGPECLPGR
jgi:altronate dehydratase large subunit